MNEWEYALKKYLTKHFLKIWHGSFVYKRKLDYVPPIKRTVQFNIPNSRKKCLKYSPQLRRDRRLIKRVLFTLYYSFCYSMNNSSSGGNKSVYSSGPKICTVLLDLHFFRDLLLEWIGGYWVDTHLLLSPHKGGSRIM